MGVDRTNYLFLGWKLKVEITDYDSFLHDVCYEVASDNFIRDDECEEYCFYGKVVRFSDRYDDGFSQEEISSEDLTLQPLEIIDLKNKFGVFMPGEELEDWVIFQNPRLFLFTHFS